MMASRNRAQPAAFFYIIVIVSLLLAACDMPVAPKPTRNALPGKSMESSRFIPGGSGYDTASIANYRVSGVGPTDLVYETVLVPAASIADYSTGSIALGDWTFRIEALDASESVLAVGTVAVTVTRESLTQPLNLTMPAGNGTLSASLSWTETDVTGSACEAVIQAEAPDGSIVTVFSGPINGGTQTANPLSLASGSYVLSAQIKVDGFAVWGTTQSALIAADKDTPAAFVAADGRINDKPGAYPAIPEGLTLPGFSTRIRGLRGGMDIRYAVNAPADASSTQYTGVRIPLNASVVTLNVWAQSTWGIQASRAFTYDYSDAVCVSPAGNDADSGSAAHPKASLQAAVDLLADLDLGTAQEIRVAAGTYADDGGIRLAGDLITIRGGYDPAFTASDPIANVTILSRASADPAMGADFPSPAIFTETGFAGTMAIENLTVRNIIPASPANTHSTAVLGAGDTPLTLRNCILSGGFGTIRSAGAAAVGSSLILRDCVANGGSGGTAIGVIFSNGAVGEISQGSAITGRTLTAGYSGPAYGVLSIASSPTITGSTIAAEDSGDPAHADIRAAIRIEGIGPAPISVSANTQIRGGMSNGQSAGIYLENVNATVANPCIIERNKIYGGHAARGDGIYLISGSASNSGISIRNNIIAGNSRAKGISPSTMSSGIYLRAESGSLTAPEIVNNTILGTLADQGSGIFLFPSNSGSVPACRTNPAIINNIIIACGDDSEACIKEANHAGDSDANPASLGYNAYFSINDGIYPSYPHFYDDDVESGWTTTDTFDFALLRPTAPGWSGLWNGVTGSASSDLGDTFSGGSARPSDADAFFAYDFSPTASAVNGIVGYIAAGTPTDGGLDLSAAGNAAGVLILFTDDFTGAPRAAPTPWCIGAYELELP